MRLTKFAHSCVLIEEQNKAILLNPGIYSWQSGLVDVQKLPELTAIVATHKHGDHLAEPFVRALVQVQPDVLWIAPEDAHQMLQEWGVQNVTAQSTEEVEVVPIAHAKVVPFGVPVDNILVHCFGKVTDPGDTHDFTETKEVLLLPVQAPWGTTIRAFELGQELQPKYLLPIHDWMWNEEWRNTVYDGLERVFQNTTTTVIRPADGRPTEI